MKAETTFLLVEDDDFDARSVKRAFSELRITNPLIRFVNGKEALDWLRDPGNVPGVILLDLNMPVMGGIEFITIVKADESLRKLPVVVLTTSHLEADRVASFNLSVAGYMRKPVDYKQLVETVRTVNLYWTLSEGL